MKILASGDHHFDARKRLEECIRVHRFMVDVARREQVDLFLSPGDVYEGTSSPDERSAVAEWLVAMAEICPVVIAKGNHDRRRDMLLMSRLKSKHPIIVEEAAGVHLVAGAAVAAVAWPDRAQLAAAVGDGSSAHLDATAHELLQNLLRGLGDQLAGFDGPRILLGHFMVDGSVTSVGQPLIGQSMNVGLAELALARPHIGILGHIHCPQEFRHDGVSYLYTGSSYRTAYGETEEKSIVLAEFDGAELRDFARVPTPCARMFLITETYDRFEGRGDPTWLEGLTGEPEYGDDGEPDYRGAEVRFRYKVPPDLRDQARARANGEIADYFRQRGAVDVKIEETVRATNSARAPEVAHALTLGDKLHALWTARGQKPPPERAERLITLATEIEQQEDIA